MSIERTAHDFLVACETGQGWAACRPFSHDDAMFSCQAARSDCVCVMTLEGDRIRHMTKVWNDSHALKQHGWA